jgi:hypothetical protein
MTPKGLEEKLGKRSKRPALALAETDHQILTRPELGLTPKVIPSAEFLRRDIMDSGDRP